MAISILKVPKIKIPGFALALAILAWGFSLPVTAAHHTPKNKTVDFAIQYIYEGNFDPVEMNYINLQFFFRSIYATLFKLDSQLKVYSFLLEKYERQGKTVIFQLKKEARFSDGSLITADDVIRSIEAGMTHSRFPNPVYKMIEGGEELFRGKTRQCSGIKSLGPQTLEIQLKDENVEFEYYFTANIMAILPHHRNKERPLDKMGFSGPFSVVDFQVKKDLTLVTIKRNPYYPGKASQIETLRLRFYKDLHDFERIINQGRTDIFLYNSGLKLPPSTYRYNYYKTPTFGAFYLKLNPKNGPFRDKQLRTYIKNVILYLDLVESEKWELTAPAKMVLPYNMTGYAVFDPMTIGDFTKSLPLDTINITCLNPEYGIRTTLMPLLKKKLKKYHLNLDLQWTERVSQVLARESKGNIDLTTYYYLADIPLSSYFYETLFTPGHELNLFGYEVPKALELLTALRQENDELKKLRILSQLEAIAQDEAFLIPLMNPLAILGYKKSIKNLTIDKFLTVNFEEIDVK